jgi:hypothetical protein
MLAIAGCSLRLSFGEGQVQTPVRLLTIVALATLTLPGPTQDKKQHGLPLKILSAKSVYFDDQSGAHTVGDKALNQLKKWGRFKIVKDPKQADLIILLAADPYKGGYVVYSGGETGTIKKGGNIQEDPVPTFNKEAPVRYAYLTVIDPKTGESLWDGSHVWGGLLTGFNSAGERLVNELRKQFEK